jgi:hypothetical protein
VVNNDKEGAVNRIKQLRIYPWSQRTNPKPNKFISGSGKTFDTRPAEKESNWLQTVSGKGFYRLTSCKQGGKKAMKIRHTWQSVIATLVVILALAGTAVAQTAGPAKPKMSTDIPPEITTPDTVETRLGTLKFFDGLPDKDTVQKVYDNLDFMRGVEVSSTLCQVPRSSPCGTVIATSARWMARSPFSRPLWIPSRSG